MDFRILGPLEVRSDNGDVICLRQPKQRATLAILLLYAGQACQPEMLAAALWGDAPPRNPGGALRTCVYAIRRALGDGARADSDKCLQSVQFGSGCSYLVKPRLGELDLQRFRDLDVQGRQALDRRDAAEADRLLSAALKCWREPPLADLPTTQAIAREVAQLLSQRRDSEDALLDARLALGRHQEVLPTLRANVTADPGRERTWAQLMRALYRCGRRKEALEAYTQARAAVVREHSAEPSLELQALGLQIFAHDPVLDLVPSAVAEILPAAPRRREWEPVCQLPADVADFTGRDSESAKLACLLAPAQGTGVPAVTVTGPPGSGKTCLAVHAAHALRARFPDGQLYVEMAGSTARPRDPSAILGDILRALAVPAADIPETVGERSSLYRSILAPRRILVVADDAHSPGQLRPLLPGTAGCAMLITSRSRMAAAAGARLLHLDVLPRAAAISMLTRIVGARRVAGDQDAAHTIVSACGFLPLAVRIAGAKLATRPCMPLAATARHLASERRRLDELTIGDLGVRASVALSYDALNPRVQRAFRLLSLTGPSFAAWQAGALLGEPEPVGVLDVLADNCLLTPEPAGATGQARYRMHELLHEYAAERLAEDSGEDTAAAQARLLTGWLELADLADRAIPREPYFTPPPRIDTRVTVPDDLAYHLTADPVAWFAEEREGLLAATERAQATGDARAAQLAHYQFAFQILDGRHDDAAYLWGKLAARARAAGAATAAAHSDLRLAVVTALAAGTTSATSRSADAMALAERCLTVFERSGDLRAQARAHCLRAHCAAAGGLFVIALDGAERGLDLAREAADPHPEFLSLRILGLTMARMGLHEPGARCCEQALALARHLREPSYEASALLALAEVRLLAGQPGLVPGLCRSGLEVTKHPGLELDQAQFLRQSATAYSGLGRHAEAIGALEHALAIFTAKNARHDRALCLLQLADSHAKLGDDRQEARCLDEAVVTVEKVGAAASDVRTRLAARQAALATRRGPSDAPVRGQAETIVEGI
jgi:DNA-binding SARP family transcriptional activator